MTNKEELTKKLIELAKNGKFDEMDELLKREELLAFVEENGWKEVSKQPNLPISFIREFKDELDWKEIILYSSFSLDEYTEFDKYIDWYEAFMFKPIPGEIFERHQDAIKSAIYREMEQSYSQGLFDANKGC